MDDETILIVDDDLGARELARAVVAGVARDAGRKVNIEMAVDGRGAIQFIEGYLPNIPALILLDLMMPVMSGFAVLDRLVVRRSTRSIRVVVVSALDYYQTIEVRSLRGVQAVVCKGDGIAALRNAVEKALGIVKENT